MPYQFKPAEIVPGFAPIGGSHITRFTGSTHDEHGFLTKRPADVARLNEHLRQKIEMHREELEMSSCDTQSGAHTLFISYGITARAMAEAVVTIRGTGKLVSTLTVQTLWPTPEHAIVNALVAARDEVRRIVVAELNLGDFHREVERTVYRWAALQGRCAPEVISLSRIDGELITPAQFIEQLV
jgi:2-oxoglutarate ferredoxin oxidoreductase subunit alpha